MLRRFWHRLFGSPRCCIVYAEPVPYTSEPLFSKEALIIIAEHPEALLYSQGITRQRDGTYGKNVNMEP